MVNYFIYAKDFSASTNKEKLYHDNGLMTLEEFKNDVEKIEKELRNAGEPLTESKIIYLHWGYECDEVDEGTTMIMYLEQIGKSMGTCPETIINWLKKNYDICGENSRIRLLYMITDGLIDRNSVSKCFELNENMNYETVVFHAFNENSDQIDLSVASSFFKGRCKVYRNYILHDSIDISNEFNYDKMNIDNFSSEKDNLKSYIKLKFLKRFERDARALKEIEKLKKLRARLFDDLTQEKCAVNLETKNKNEFLHEFVRTNWYKNLVANSRSIKIDVEKSISTLINYIVSENKSYSFDALRFDTNYNEPVEEEPIVDVNFSTEQEIAFPDIILEDEKGIPVLILMKLDLLDKLIFHGKSSCENVPPASFSKFKSTMECPLFLVNDKDISESIGYFYTFNVYKQFLANNINTEPRTRKPFHGGLVLTDTDQFDKYNDYVLSATYFDSKKVNFNVGLFYYFLWKNCESKEWMDRNVVERFEKYTMRRINETVCKIGLSSLPLDPQKNTSLLTALWYCVELSSCIFKDDPQNFNHERLRMYCGVAHHMIEILKYFNYDLDLKYIERRRELLCYVMILKKIQTHREKVYYLLEKIFKTMDGFLVSELENPSNIYKLNYLKFNHKHMLSDDVVKEIIHLNDCVHLLHFVGNLEDSKDGKGSFEICENTFRPFFAIDSSKSFYMELVKDTRKVVISNDDDPDKVKVSFVSTDSLEFDRTLSLYNLFINCVKDLEKYPTLPEYVEYIKHKKKFYGDMVTIFPSNVYFDIKNVFRDYQNIVTKVDVKKFIQVCKAHAGRIERIKTEKRVKFDSNNEINEFISKEELKVNLKKK